jgi:branched-chain amino acid transport system permease protein
MRAVSLSPEASSLQGVYSDRVLLMTLGMGCALAGFAGGLLAPNYGINPAMGNEVLWTVMLMCMLGGIDSLPGAVVAGILIGQILSFGQYYLGSTVQICVFLIIGITLYFRPNGLMGRGIDVGI